MTSPFDFDPDDPAKDPFKLEPEERLATLPPAPEPEPEPAFGHDPTTLADAAPAKRNKRVLVGVGVGAALLVGLASYGFSVRSDRNRAAAALDDARSENQKLTDALEIHRASSDSLGEKLETCSGDLEVEKTSAQESTARVAKCEAGLVAAKSQVTDLRKQRAEAKSRLAEFNAVTRSFQSMINTGRLKVVFRDGQMIVKLPAKILFASGKAEISKNGKQALADVAKILSKMGKRKFTVAGHTDNIGISTAEFGSNWELSSARAVAVVQTLTARGVPPRRLVAAGFGPYSPISTNKTAAGRARNRRIEIILEPYLRPPPKIAKKLNKKKKKK